MFGTLYIFTLLGLVLKLVSDLTYMLVDPRIDFEAGPRDRVRSPSGAASTLAHHAAHPRGGWRNFRANRRGYWSLWIFSALFVFSLFAELIANDRPLLVRYDGELYFPVFEAYPETDLRRRSSRPRPTTATPSSRD